MFEELKKKKVICSGTRKAPFSKVVLSLRNQAGGGGEAGGRGHGAHLF